MEEKYPVGTKVYYSLEDYDIGEDIVYEGVIQDIYYQDLKLKNKTVNMKLYKITDGLSVQQNCFYTLEELMKMKERLEVLCNTCVKDELLDTSDK